MRFWLKNEDAAGLRGLGHQDPAVRSAAVDELVEQGSDALDSLLRVVMDGRALARKSAMEALGRIGDARAVPVLCNQLEDDGLNNYRTAAAALAEIGDLSALPFLCARVRDEAVAWSLERLVRRDPERALPRAVPELRKRTHPSGGAPLLHGCGIQRGCELRIDYLAVRRLLQRLQADFPGYVDLPRPGSTPELLREEALLPRPGSLKDDV